MDSSPLHGKDKNVCRTVVRKSEWRTLLGRPSHRWGDNIRKKVKETGTEVWTGFTQFGTGSIDGLL